MEPSGRSSGPPLQYFRVTPRYLGAALKSFSVTLKYLRVTLNYLGAALKSFRMTLK
jgi:hypothetical protein